ncbi:MAG: hypothetical protein ACN4GZ_20120 [Acidimicrobiales bacterium]
MESQPVRRVEPVMEEFTGPFMLGVLGGFLLRLPSFGAGPIDDSHTVGLVAVVCSLIGLVALSVRHLRWIRTTVRITPIVAAPYPGELGAVPGVVVKRVVAESPAEKATEDRTSELPKAA